MQSSLGRFSETAFHVLMALADGPRHASSMTVEIEAVAGRRPGPGTLYGAIARLEARRLIEALPAEDRRRRYRLTAAGARVLRARLDALDRTARPARARFAHT